MKRPCERCGLEVKRRFRCVECGRLLCRNHASFTTKILSNFMHRYPRSFATCLNDKRCDELKRRRP